jgi:hypothetical protein
LRRAIALFERAVRLFEEVHDYFNAGVAMRNLARCHRVIDEIDVFKERLVRARQLLERAGAMEEIAGFVTATRLSYDASQDGRRLGGHRRCVPLLHHLGSEEAQRAAGDQEALNIERVVDGACMARKR